VLLAIGPTEDTWVGNVGRRIAAGAGAGGVEPILAAQVILDAQVSRCPCRTNSSVVFMKILCREGSDGGIG
jgi:hypothetical protein